MGADEGSFPHMSTCGCFVIGAKYYSVTDVRVAAFCRRQGQVDARPRLGVDRELDAMPGPVDVDHDPGMVEVVGRDVAGDNLGRDADAAQHGRAQGGVVEADAVAARERGVRVGDVAGGRRELLGLGGVVGDVVRDEVADGAQGGRLVVGTGGELAGPAGGGAVLVEVAVEVGVQEGLEPGLEVHGDARGEQLDVVVAARVLHDADGVGAVAHVHGDEDGRAVAGHVVVVALLATGDLELEARRAVAGGAHVALGGR